MRSEEELAELLGEVEVLGGRTKEARAHVNGVESALRWALGEIDDDELRSALAAALRKE